MNTDNSTVRIIVDRTYLLRLEFLISSSCQLSMNPRVRIGEFTGKTYSVTGELLSPEAYAKHLEDVLPNSIKTGALAIRTR